MKSMQFIKWTIGIVLFILILYIGNVFSIKSLPRINIYPLFLVFITTICFSIIHNIRWISIVEVLRQRPKEKKISFFNYYRWLVNSYVMGLIIPIDISFVGVRMFYMHRENMMMPHNAIFSLLFDRLLDLIVFIPFLIPTILFTLKITSYTNTLMLILILYCIVFIFISKEKSFLMFLKVYNTVINIIFKAQFMKKIFNVNTIPLTDYTLFKPKTLYAVFGLSIIKYLLLGVKYYFLGVALNVNLSFAMSILIISLIQVSCMINITPGGLGIVELGTYGTMKLIGIDEAQILPFVLGQRIIFTACMVIIALLTNIASSISHNLRIQNVE